MARSNLDQNELTDARAVDMERPGKLATAATTFDRSIQTVPYQLNRALGHLKFGSYF